MVRTQIQLEEETAERLKQAAARRGVSMAEMVRRGVDRVLEEDLRKDAWERALAVVGKYHGDGTNVSENHDEYLADAYEDWRR